MPRALALPAAAALLQLNRLALRTRLFRPIDGWRRAAGLVLRDPRSCFILSTFNLDIWSDAPRAPSIPTSHEESLDHLFERLDAFLEHDPTCNARVYIHSPLEDYRDPTTLSMHSLGHDRWVDGPDRFIPPTEWHLNSRHRRHPGDRAHLPFEFIARISPHPPYAADLWLRVNHVAADGAPVQELLTRLEQAWGIAEPVLFPSPDRFTPRSTPIRRGVHLDTPAQLQFFADFAPLLAWRKAQNAKLPEPMTVAAAILYRLAQLREFNHLHLGTTVEVEATRVRSTTIPRGVGVVVTKPANFPDLASYVADFNRQLALTRARQSPNCRTLDAAAHLPAPLAHALLEHALTNVPRAFGALALTMLKDAKVFGAPLAQHGHSRGFIAIGGLNLPTRDGRAVGCVTVKGPPAAIAPYPRHFAEALAGSS